MWLRVFVCGLCGLRPIVYVVGLPMQIKSSLAVLPMGLITLLVMFHQGGLDQAQSCAIVTTITFIPGLPLSTL